MNQEIASPLNPRTSVPVAATGDSHWQASAVSWGAIVGGAVAAAALTLILLILGAGLGLSSISPYSGRGAGAATFGISTIAWLTFTQLVASGMGGYLAGRLRTHWAGTHTDEVYFRDTAHGFLTWALASIVTAALLGSVIATIVGGGAQAGAAALTAGGTAAASSARGSMRAEAADGTGYYVDSLFRKNANGTTPAVTPAVSTSTASTAGGDDSGTGRSTGEASRIFVSSVQTGALSPEDTKYVGQLVAERTGLSQADAEKRVSDVFTRMQARATQIEASARDKAEQARKASAYAALWLFVSLLIGAFVASLAATYGGRRRDLQ